MVRWRTATTQTTLAILGAALLAAGCGRSDGGLSVSSPAEPTPASTVQASGIVRMPNGQVAQAAPALSERLASLMIRAAEALSAASVRPVGAGVRVSLGLQRSDGTITPVGSATETDSSGRYVLSIPGSSDPASVCRYVAYVGDAESGTLTRAFVTAPNANQDIDFNSEATVRLILARAAEGADLCSVRARDLQGLTDDIRDLAGDVSGVNAADVNQKARLAAGADGGIQSLLDLLFAPTATPVRSVRATLTATLPRTATPTFTRTGSPSSTVPLPNSPTPTRTTPFTATHTSVPTRTFTLTPTGVTATVTQPPNTSTPTALSPTPSRTPTLSPTVFTATFTATVAGLTPTTAGATATFTPTSGVPTTPPATATATITPSPGGTITSRRCNLRSGINFSVVRIKTTIGLALNVSLSGFQTWEFSDPDANGVRNIAIPRSGTHFNGVTVLGLVKVCPRSGGDGAGLIDCDGGAPDYDVIAEWDHNTSDPPGPNGGHPQDPECDNSFTNPGNQVSHASIESPTDIHPGICNGPLTVRESGTFVAGGMKLTEQLYVRIVTDLTQACPPDDTPFSEDDGDFSISGVVTTGQVSGTVFDAMSPAAPWTLTQTNLSEVGTGSPFGCDNINNSILNTGKTALSIPVIDLSLATIGNSDVVATLQLQCQ